MIIAGFGGQGVLTLGVLIANSTVIEGKNSTWLPSYGPEMRGGTANCHVILSSEEIGSPIVNNPDILIVFNNPSLEKFFSKLKKDGILIYNSSLIKNEIEQKNKIGLPLVKLAKQIGTKKVINTIALGALIQETGIVKKDSVIKSLEEKFKGKQEVIQTNKKALKLGMDYVKN